MSESQLQAKVLKYLKSEGHYAIKVINANRAGCPDILACIDGKFIAIECKSPGGKVTKLQQYHHDQIQAAGGSAYVVYSDGWSL